MNYDYKAAYQTWCEQADAKTREELLAIAQDDNEIKERFYKELEFGTAGLRGILGAGTNRMNVYTVRRATQGLADCVNQKGAHVAARGVAISYDCRHFSEEFAHEAACVLAANGIPVYLYSEMQPTPALSFAVRHLKTAAGIMITASHNPANYNGYKVYGEDGAQMNVEDSATVLARIRQTDIFSGVKRMEMDEAQAKGLEGLKNANIDQSVLRLKGIDALKDVADGRATKIFMPTDLQNVVSVIGTIGETLGIGDSEAVDRSPKEKPDPGRSADVKDSSSSISVEADAKNRDLFSENE